MMTLVGSLLGFLSSAFPEILRTYRDRKDRDHELAVLDRQIEMQKSGLQGRLDEIHTQADAVITKALYQHARPTGIGWIDGLAGTVRPLITYAFFFLYAAVKGAIWLTTVRLLGENQWAEGLIQLWSLEDQALFAAVMSFWFGQRLFGPKGGVGFAAGGKFFGRGGRS